MKKRMTSLLLALLMVLTLLPTTAWAEDAVTSGSCGTNVTWELTNGVLTISGDGAMEDYSNTSPAPWDAIRDTITAIDVQDGVTVISDDAFAGCTNATSVKLGPSVTEIGDGAFGGCNMAEIVFPSGLVKIGLSAFWGCNSLLEVDLPASVTVVMGWAFDSCKNLKKVITHPGETLSFRSGCFMRCPALEEVILAEGLTEIDYNVFDRCTSLKEVICPDSLKSINQSAFSNCTALTRVHIGKGLRNLGYITSDDFAEDNSFAAFEYCDNLATITVDPENPYLTAVNNVVYSKDMKKLIRYPCAKEGEYIVPDTVNFIKRGAFHSCKKLTSLALPEGVTKLKESTIYDCISLKTVYWPKSLKEIEAMNFYNPCLEEYIPVPNVIYYAGTEQEWAALNYLVPSDTLAIYYECEMPVAVTPGDLDNNGTLDIQDMQTIYEYLTGQSELTKNQLKAADFNQDGVVDVYDLQALYEYVAYHSN